MFKTRGIEKLKKILINDKHFHPSFFADLIRSEMFKSLSNYMELSPDDVLVNISIDEKVGESTCMPSRYITLVLKSTAIFSQHLPHLLQKFFSMFFILYI